MVKISIIMPVFNAETFLETSCQSLFNQTLKDIELICIDDGSTDNSLSKLYKLKEKYNSIKIFTQENQGSGKARNLGIDKASGEYIAFLDADDIFVDKEALEKMYQFGIENDANMVGANLKRVSPKGVLEDNFNYKDGNYAFFSEFGIIPPNEYGVPWAFYKNIFKRDFLNKYNIRFPDLKRGQDPVLLAEVLVNLDKIATVPVDLYGYNYAVGGGANSKVNDYTKKYDFIKHYKDTFEILENAGFDAISNKYKKLLAIHLKLNRNKNDQELHDITWKIFGDNVYYDKFKEKLFNIRVPHILEDFDENNSKENIVILKNSFFNMSFVDDYFTPYDTMKKFLSITNTYNNDVDSLKLISDINKSLSKKKVNLKSKQKILIKEKEYLENINNDLNSKLPNLIVNDLINSIAYNDIKTLKIEILTTTLNDKKLITPKLMEEYLSIMNSFNYTDESHLEKLEAYYEKLSIENEYLNKEKNFLENDLLKLKYN